MTPQPKPKFERTAAPILTSALRTLRTRGRQYGDTWETCQFLALRAVAKQLKLAIPTSALRAIATAALVDLKYERLRGGYNPDHLLDGINYAAYLVGEMSTDG
jgi:hypothetical protein